MKVKRHALILEIIASQEIDTQEGLTRALSEAGINVTQATVSRDIRELKLIKTATNHGTYRYTAGGAEENEGKDRYLRIFSELVTSVNAAGNLVVLKTITAAAQTAAEAIDNLQWPEIIGTIAGENTVLAIIKNLEDTDDVAARLKELTGKRF
ncbi:MAG: arginine repressor [Clostridiales bacterium]|nr:arginine repressor [Clostridiales bacterium]